MKSNHVYTYTRIHKHTYTCIPMQAYTHTHTLSSSPNTSLQMYGKKTEVWVIRCHTLICKCTHSQFSIGPQCFSGLPFSLYFFLKTYSNIIVIITSVCFYSLWRLFSLQAFHSNHYTPLSYPQVCCSDSDLYTLCKPWPHDTTVLNSICI